MPIQSNASPIDIAVSGMRAEGMRLKLISNNIANAHTSRTDNGEPYRRLDLLVQAKADELNGVEIDEVVSDDETAFQKVYMPGHPHADQGGFVLMPNVNVPQELMHMVNASRSYQANATAIQQYRGMMDAAREILR
jgi:flagellar basal-body rod protein FlgC